MAVGAELLSSAGEYLMSSSLVPDIPDETVARGVEDIVQRHGELHDAKGAGEVPGIAGHLFYDVLPQLAAHLRKRFQWQAAQIGGQLYIGEKRLWLFFHENAYFYPAKVIISVEFCVHL